MGATVIVVDLSVSSWTKQKPAAYKDKTLDAALKALEGVTGKEVKLSADTISALEKRITWLKAYQAALNSVVSAAGAASSELAKLAVKAAKAKDDEEEAALTFGSSTAGIIGEKAAKALKTVV